jgi:SAM-dependent methyltransferase
LAAVTQEQRARTLERFEAHRQAWAANAALRSLYQDWYGKIRGQLPAAGLGPFVELGSGPGFARDFIPELQLSDLVRAPWHDHAIDAAARLPFDDGSLGALVLFDVLHHLASPTTFFEEATRVLAPGGRIVLCEPSVSPLSYPVYRWFHDEDLDLSVDPFVDAAVYQAAAKDPFESNQAIPTLMFARARGRVRFAERFPALRFRSLERFAGPAYAASGGFGRQPLLPLGLWKALYAIETVLPSAAFRAIGFRMLVVLERSGG